MPDRVLAAMHRAAPNIYAGGFVETVPGIVADLKAVARSTGEVAIYIANGHGAWEAAACNVFARGDRALALVTGRFGAGWAEMVRALGVRVDMVDFGPRAPVDPARVTEALLADTGHEIRAVLCVQTDTSTSVRNDIAAIRAAIDAAGHPALLMVDCMASLGCDRFEMDAWGVDVMVAGCQKGLMTPPGLGFVFFNARADAARERADCVTHYWDWRPRVSPPMFYRYFDGTAPTHHLFGLRAALDMIAEEGIEAVWARHAALSRAIWAAAEAWGQGGPVALNIADPAFRSHSVTTFRAGPVAVALRDWAERTAGVTLGLGLAPGPGAESEAVAGQLFRIGHMGHVNAQMVLGALGAVEAGMRAVGIPFGAGGLSAAAEAVAAGA